MYGLIQSVWAYNERGDWSTYTSRGQTMCRHGGKTAIYTQGEALEKPDGRLPGLEL